MAQAGPPLTMTPERLARPASWTDGGRGRVWLIVGLAINTLLILALGDWLVWRPVVRHYAIPFAMPSAAVVGRHRLEPATQALAVVADASMVTDHPLTGDDAVQAARRILEGQLVLPYLPALSVDPDFAEHDLAQGAPVQQLFVASLIVPDLLLRANEHRPDAAFVAAARRYLAGFMRYERRQSVPVSWLWNAHAVTNRVAVLARFWRETRASETDEVALLLHEHAVRLGAFLSKPELFTARTNHGMMQNLGLLELATAFPALPDSRRYREIALSRIEQQLPFYVSPEGAVLEHSAGYHFHGVVLTGFMIKVLEAGGMAVPPALRNAHATTLGFLARMQRPDGSLPLWGNTFRYQWRLPRLLGIDSQAWDRHLRERPSFDLLQPVSGHAIWWSRDTPSGLPTHSMINWGQFAGHGHQRAQEMSLFIWADGIDWSTNTGYWPGTDPKGEFLAAGWDGGNGPHALEESPNQLRHTELRAHVEQGPLRMLDLERTVDATYKVRRQTVQWAGALWLVLDSYVDAQNRPLRSVWTAAPETEIQALGPRRFIVRREGGGVSLALSFAGSDGVGATTLRGSLSPFGGWVAFNRRAAPAPSIDARLERPSGWMLTLAELVPSPNANGVTLVGGRFDSPEDWALRLTSGEVPMTITRRGTELRVEEGARTTSSRLRPAPDVSAPMAVIDNAFAEIAADHPRVRLHEDERRLVVRTLVAAWVLMSVVLLAATLRHWRRLAALWLAANLAWGALVAFAVLVHLRA